VTNWFHVDKKGLAKLMEGRTKAFVLYELIQNAWDEATKSVEVVIQPVQGTRNVQILVEDDNPEGFKDIAPYVVVLLMLVVRPNGIFGEKLRKKV
jgi:branched-subunit amino acid ABC-type transport system permease component